MSENLKGLYIKDKHTEYIVNDSINIESLSILTPEYIQEHITDFVDNDRLVVNHLIYYKVNDKLTSGEGGYVLLPAMLPFIFEAHETGKLVYININTEGNGNYIIIDQDNFEYESGEFEGGTKVIPNVPLDGTEPILESLEVDGEKFKVDRGNKVTPNIEDIDVNELQRLTNVKIENETFSTSPRLFNLYNESYNLDELPEELLDKVNIGDVIYGNYADEDHPTDGYILTMIVKDSGYLEFRGTDYRTNSKNVRLSYTKNSDDTYMFISFDIVEEEIVEPINIDICASPGVKYNYYYNVEPFGIDFPSNRSIADKGDVWTVGGNLFYSNNSNTYKYDKNKYEWVYDRSSSYASGRNYFIYNNVTYCIYANGVYKISENGTWTNVDKFKNVEGSGSCIFYGRYIWSDGDNLYYSDAVLQNTDSSYHQLVYDDSTDTWKLVTWNGLNPLGTNIWSDGINIYYSDGSRHYELDKKTLTWNRVNFSGDLSVISTLYLWSDGENVFYSNNDTQYLFDRDNKKWIRLPSVMIRGETIFTDGDDIFCMNGNGANSTYKLVKCYTNTKAKPSMKGTSNDREFIPKRGLIVGERNKLNVNVGSRLFINDDNKLCAESSMPKYVIEDSSPGYLSLKYEQKTWSGLSNLYGNYIWTDGDNIYYSDASSQYVLDRETLTWSTKTWTGLTNFKGDYIWTYDGHIYYSNGNVQMELNKSTSTWTGKTWTGLTNFSGDNVWTDGINVYCTGGWQTDYILNSNSSWSQITWDGINTLYGHNIWTDGNDIYYANYGTYKLYQLDTTNRTCKIVNNDFRYRALDIIHIDGYSCLVDNYTFGVWDKTKCKFNSNSLPRIFIGRYIWTDYNNNIYYSNGVNQYAITFEKVGSHCKSISIHEDVPRINPTLTGNEPLLTGLQFGNNKFRVPQGGATISGTNDGTNWTSLTIGPDTYDIPRVNGSIVDANPTLVGDEPNLTSVEIEGVKFKIPDGSSSGDFTRYVHTILVNKSTISSGIGGGYPAAIFSINLILRSNESIDSYAKLKTYLINTIVESDNDSPYIQITGSLYNTSNGKNELFAMNYSMIDDEIFIYYTELITDNGQSSLVTVGDWLAHDAVIHDFVHEL